MAEETPRKECRSVDSEGTPCVKSRGHKAAKHSDGKGGYWLAGINKPAVKVPKSSPDQFANAKKYVDDGYMTEGDHQSWGRIEYF